MGASDWKETPSALVHSNFTVRAGERETTGQRPTEGPLISGPGVAGYFMETKRRTRSAHRPRARAGDVLAQSITEPRIHPRWRKYYNRLVDLRNYLVQRQGDLVKNAKEERPSFSMHMADAGTDTFDRDFALSMISSEQDALYEIDQALIRIRDGTYGRCEMTGARIESGRLEAIPWTRFSAEAEKKLEKEGGVARARLGPRESMPKGTTAQREEGEE